MAREPDEERIRRKAHELWVAEGHPHGRDQEHWDQAKEIIAIEDSQATTLLPRDAGAREPVEPRQAVENYGDVPNLTDQGEHPLTDISREPAPTSPSRVSKATGASARPAEKTAPGIKTAASSTKSGSAAKKSSAGADKAASKATSKPNAGAKGQTPPGKGG